jgi:spermidine synthase
VRLAVTVPLLIVPTVLMGATLPVVTSAMVREDRATGRGVALVYGANTVGAALGAYATAYLLLPALGVVGSILAAVAANLLVGAVALAMDRAATEQAAPAPSADSAAAAPRRVMVTAAIATFLAGFAFIVFEIVWARLVSSILEGTIYGVGAVLICFLLGIGAGSMLAARKTPSRATFGIWFAALQAITIVSVALVWWALPHLAQALKLATGAPHTQLVIVAVCLFVPTACSGASFPLLVRLVEGRARRTGRALGSLYATNTVGSILGALVGGFVILPVLGSVGAMVVGTGCVAAVGVLGATVTGTKRLRIVAPVLPAAALVVVGLLGGFPQERLALALAPFRPMPGSWLLRRPELPPIVSFGEGINATVAVYRTGGMNMYINGLPQGTRRDLPPRTSLEGMLTALVPLVHRPEPASALVVGLGTGMTVESLHRLGVPEITVVELESRVVEAVEAIYPEGSPLGAEGVRLELNDARHALLRNAKKRERTYDLITSMPFHPWAASHLFTREFFELAAANLSPGGVFSTWLGLSRLDPRSMESIVRAFCEVFGSYVVYHVPRTGALFLVGSKTPLTIDPAHLESLVASPLLRGYPELRDPYFLPASVHASGEAGTPPPLAGVVNSDDSVWAEVRILRERRRRRLEPGFLPCEYLLPSLVPEPRRQEVFDELLERLLGTPGGRFPLVRSKPRLDRARRTLAALDGVLGEPEAEYFAGRVALEEGWPIEARRRFEIASAAGGEIARRAGRFKALCEPAGSKRRLEELAALGGEPDIVLEALEIDRTQARELVLERDAAAHDDPLGWFLERWATVAPGALSDEDRRRFVREIGGVLCVSDRAPLLAELEAFAREQGLERVAAIYAARLGAAGTAQYEQLLGEGIQAAAAGRQDAALEALWAATELAPLDDRAVEPLLRALAATGDHARASAFLDELRCRGRSPEAVAALWEAARNGTPEHRTASVEAGR